MAQLISKDPIDLFGSNIFELLGMENAPQDKKDSLIKSMTETIQSRIVGRILDALSSDQTGLAEFERLLDSGPQEAIEAFLETKGLDIGQMTAEETLLYKTEFIEKMTSN